MVPGTMKGRPQERPKNRWFYENPTLKTDCHDGIAESENLPYPDLTVNFRTDFINQPIKDLQIPEPEKVVHPIDIHLGYKNRKLGNNPQDFHEIINVVIKQILKKMYLENDALKLFLYLSKIKKSNKKDDIEINSVPFKKLLMISQSMKIHEYEKINIDSISQRLNTYLVKKVMDIKRNAEKYRIICQISAIIKMKSHLFQLFDEYETKKLCYEKAWSIHENVTSGRSRWAATLLTNVMNNFGVLEEKMQSPSPTKFYWHLAKTVTHLRNQVLLMSGPESKNNKSKVEDWKILTERLIGFRENIREKPLTHLRKLFDFFSHTDTRRKVLAREIEEILPYSDVFYKKSRHLRDKEKELMQLREETAKVIKLIPRYGVRRLK